MTIYLIKYRFKEDGDSREYFACSSVTDAEKKLRQLSKDNNIQVEVDEEQGPIRVLRPKTQKDVINLINEL